MLLGCFSGALVHFGTFVIVISIVTFPLKKILFRQNYVVLELWFNLTYLNYIGWAILAPQCWISPLMGSCEIYMLAYHGWCID